MIFFDEGKTERLSHGNTLVEHIAKTYVFITHDSPQLKKGGVYGFHGQAVRLIKRVPPPEYG